LPRRRDLGIHHYRPEADIVRTGRGQECAKIKGEEIIMALKVYTQQGELWGPSPDSVISAGHVARAINEIIESLGLERLNRRYEHTPGEPAYDVRMLCKVIIYAYSRGITSSREMGRQCEENLAFRFLTGGQCPDHRTLSGFRRKKRHLLRWVFVKTVRLAREMGIAKLGLVAIDSVKLQADVRASSKQTADELREELKQLDAYLVRLEETDQKENQQFGEAKRGD
jgi:transposase